MQNIFWGWYVVLSAFIIMIIIYGARYSFGVFVKPMFAEYGWPMTIISFGASINLMMYASMGIAVGWVLDKIAPKWIMTAGVVITAIGFISASLVKTPMGLYLSYGVLCGIGSAGSGAVATSTAVGKWFMRKRGLAIGLSTMGIGVGTIIMTPLAGYIEENYGWRNGFLFIALLTFVLGIIISQIFMGKTCPEEYGLLPDGQKPCENYMNTEGTNEPVEKPSLKPVLQDTRFWLLAFCNIFAVMFVMMTFVHQIPYAIDKGIDKMMAATAVGLIGITGSFGKFFFGWLSDRINDAKYSASLGFFLMAISMFILCKVKSIAILYLFALVFGFGYGSLAPVMPYLVSDRFGRHILGSAYGLLNFFATGVGGSIGPILGGYIFDKTGSYLIAWKFNEAILFIVSLLILTLRPAKKAQT